MLRFIVFKASYSKKERRDIAKSQQNFQYFYKAYAFNDNKYGI